MRKFLFKERVLIEEEKPEGGECPVMDVEERAWASASARWANAFVKWRNKEVPILDDGYITLLDVMGSDHDIAQAARTSFGKGTKTISDDETLIRHLMRHVHTSPFEMAELKFKIRIPMDHWRQMIRHRTACLAGDAVLQFDLPKGGDGPSLYKLTVAEIYQRFQPTSNQNPDRQKNGFFRRDRVQAMRLRCVNESERTPKHTTIVDIWESGEKPVYRVTTGRGFWTKTSADHLYLTDRGWLKLKDIIRLPEEGERPDNNLATARLLVVGPGVGTGVKTSLVETDSDLENWVPIAGWEAYYEVSDFGRVRRVSGGRGSRSFGRCKALTESQGRLVVSLNRPGQQEVCLVHRLVATAFLGDAPEDCQVCHNDGNALNNRADNLRWDTVQSNADDRTRDGATTRLGTTYDSIDTVEFVGIEMTYDLEVAGPDHNFSSGGIIVHNSVNEYSTRYSEAIDEKQKTPADAWRLQAVTNKQGSREGALEWPDDYTRVKNDVSGEIQVLIDRPGDTRLISSGSFTGEDLSPGEYLSRQEDRLHELADFIYKERLKFGVAKEQARKDLPLSNYTEAIWKCDIHNLLHYLRLRMDEHAQLEIRSYASAIAEIVKDLFPQTWQAFEDYRLNAVSLSAPEIRIVHALGQRDAVERISGELKDDASPISIFFDEAFFPKNQRERQECVEKMRKLELMP
jgi:thymidylate synthase ThyX